MNQAETLSNIIKRLATGKNEVDLSLIKGGKSIGALTIGKNITGKEIYLIENSVTGIKNKITRL